LGENLYGGHIHPCETRGLPVLFITYLVQGQPKMKISMERKISTQTLKAKWKTPFSSVKFQLEKKGLVKKEHKFILTVWVICEYK
jgi:hypothetical protein